jgi:nucleobase:cation symporter-1, NCS1 family
MLSPKTLVTRCSEKLQEKKTATKRAFSSRADFIRALETDESAYGRESERTIWKNEDLDLTPPKQWSWGWYDYAAFWWSYGFSVVSCSPKVRLVSGNERCIEDCPSTCLGWREKLL